MLNDIKKLSGTKNISKSEQKELNGGRPPIAEIRCGGDGSFIYVDGRKVCCYDWRTGNYFC
ncbi:MAG: hypothetical protein WBA74_14410 [Cyclobacteriaceae bacterium]